MFIFSQITGQAIVEIDDMSDERLRWCPLMEYAMRVRTGLLAAPQVSS